MANHASISLIYTSLSESQPANALAPMLVTLSGIVMLVSALRQLNAESPILVTGKPLYSEAITISVYVAVPMLIAI